MADTDGSEPSGDNGIAPNGDGNAVPPKRKRGRPANTSKPADSSGDGISGDQSNQAGAAETGPRAGTGAEAQAGAVNPETFVSGEAPKKRRGRPPGSGTRTKAETAETLNIGDLASEIEGTYAMLGVMFQNSAFMIGSAKAEMLARNMANMAKHYNFTTDTKAIATLKFVGAMGIVNVPIVMALAQQAAFERSKRAKPATVAATVEEIVPGATAPNGARPPYRFDN